jgi:uncharacterized surface protein with fasciclin (FAS1) repeats
MAALCLSSVAQAPGRDIAAIVAGDRDFTTFARLLRDAGVLATLRGSGPFTVFAPTDEAFRRLPRATFDAITKDRALLRRVVNFHVVRGELLSTEFAGRGSVRSVEGSRLRVSLRGRQAFLGGRALIVRPDIRARNGVIHGIGKVLLPPMPPAVARPGVARPR